MAGNILTPLTLWGNFKTDVNPTCTIIDEKQDGDVLTSRCYVDGKMARTERVKIFVTITKIVKTTKSPCIVMLNDFSNEQEQELTLDIVKKGYVVVSIDLAGKAEDKEYYTVYPEELEYANYSVAKEELYTGTRDVNQACWYEWGCVVRYVLEYLKGRNDVASIGGLGIAEASTVLWQVAGMDKTFACVAFVLNSGWLGYRGIYKFGGQVEPQFSDDMYKFIAGVEPQAYAKHITCPTLMLSATNSDSYDCDRAYDTVSRIEKDVYKAVHYSVGHINCVDEEAYDNLLLFYDVFLKSTGRRKKSLPEEMDIKAELIDGKIKVIVEPDLENIKDVTLFVSEETVIPSQRCWFRVTDYEEKTENGFVFNYVPYHGSTMATFFAKVEYKNGFVICSNIIAKKFNTEEIYQGHKSNIVYSSRIDGGESVFLSANQGLKRCKYINVSNIENVKVMKGPMDIEGVCCESGLVTFKINASKDKPYEDAMFMFDAYLREDGEITVKLITDYYGAKNEYVAKIKVLGGEVWHNVKLEKSKFKTAEGMGLKNYDKVNAIEFNADGVWLINNALWV